MYLSPLLKIMIRPYTPSDDDQIVDVWYQATTLAHPFMDAAFLQKEADNIRNIYLPNTNTWVVPNETGLDGFISMIDNEVGAIFVRPEKHGQGIGKQLMDLVREQYEVLEVEVFEENAIGRRFYDRYGFEVIKQHTHEETQRDLLRMRYKK